MDGTWLVLIIFIKTVSGKSINSGTIHFVDRSNGCLAPRGQFAHELYCDKYYDCWDATIYIKQCPDDLLFNAEKLYCDWPENVYCGTRKLRQSGSYNLCPREFGIFADPYNCYSFIHCSHGIPNRKYCPVGTAFNSAISVCDYEKNVRCYSGVESTAPSATTQHDSPVFTCPSVRGLFPYSNSCSKFWLCRNYTPVLVDCPSPQLFDVIKYSCVNAEQAVCANRRNIPTN